MTPVRAAPDEDVDALGPQVGLRQTLVRRVGLDEGESPRREGRADDAGDDDQRLAAVRAVGTTSPRPASPQSGWARNAAAT